MAKRRRYRRNDGFDPVPWIIGVIIAGAAYELFQVIVHGSSSSASAGGPVTLTTGSVPGQGGGADF